MGPERTIYKSEAPLSYRMDICARSIRALAPGPGGGSCDSEDNALDPAACLSNDCQPSCLDTNYTACVNPGGASDWNSAAIYRPINDLRRCDVHWLSDTYDWQAGIATGPVPPGVVYHGVSHEVDTNVWAYCVNAGYDPPAHWSKNYRGAMTGALTDTTLCGPQWSRCSSAGSAGVLYFPAD
jgi:hypothetical protein